MTPMVEARQRRRLTATVTDLDVEVQRALVVGVDLPGINTPENSLDELALLTSTAGSVPVASELLRREKPEPATFIGTGQLSALVQDATADDIDVVVFDNDLTPGQQRNLTKAFKCDVVDRRAVILDIFAQHATSREGMLQVELALLEYHLPRLTGQGTALSRQAGGIGTRGPGETKLETDRRRIGERITKLKRDIKHLEKVRATQAKARRKHEVPLIALVGYTNAGKSTLMNRLAHADVLARNQLFSTLQSTVRKTEIDGLGPVLFSDTVGFVQRLPHQLVAAFKSTLDQIADADFKLHVVDASHPDPAGQIEAVRLVLEGIEGVSEIPELLVLNKMDQVSDATAAALTSEFPEAIRVSARQGDGINELERRLADRVAATLTELDLLIPYSDSRTRAKLYDAGSVIKDTSDETGHHLTVRVHPDRVEPLLEFQVESLNGSISQTES